MDRLFIHVTSEELKSAHVIAYVLLKGTTINKIKLRTSTIIIRRRGDGPEKRASQTEILRSAPRQRS